MEIGEIVAGWNAAMKLIDDLAQQYAQKEPYAWVKLDRIRSYIKKAAVQECDNYFSQINEF